MLKHHGIRDYDPLLALADISVDTTVPIKIRAQCTMELCGYVHAKRRAVDINSSGETPINFIIAGPNSPVVGE